MVALLRRAADQAGLIGEHMLVSALLGAAARLVDPGETAALIALHTARHAALYSAGRLDDADEEYRAIQELRPTALERADAAALQVHSLTHRSRFAEAVALGAEILRQLGLAVPATDRFGDDLERQFGHLYRWLDHTDDADELAPARDHRPDAAGHARLINAMLPAAYLSLTPRARLAGLEALRIWLEHGPAAALVGPVSHTAFAAVALRGDYAAGSRALRRTLALGEARGYEPGTSQARFIFAMLACWSGRSRTGSKRLNWHARGCSPEAIWPTPPTHITRRCASCWTVPPRWTPSPPRCRRGWP